MTPFTGDNQPTKIAYSKGLKIPVYNDKLLMRISKDADILWSTVIFDDEQIRRMLDIRKWSGAKWIVDMDDNMFDVKKDNPGDQGVKAAMDNIKLCLSLADGLTVSVPYLKEIYSRFNDNIFIVKNGIDPLEWDFKNSKNKKITIGWRGAYGHQQDLNLIGNVLQKIKEDYDVVIHTFGVKPTGIKVDKHTDWVSLQKYPETLASLGFDIAIVPLIDSSYNRCKSNLSYLEYSMLKIPTVVTPTENQKGCGSLEARSNYEWYDLLEKLIKSKKMRETQGKSQYDLVLKDYNVGEFVKPLAKWFEELPRKNLEMHI